MRTDPQHLPDWQREQNEIDEADEQEYWRQFDKHVPLDLDAEEAPWNESEEDDGQ